MAHRIAGRSFASMLQSALAIGNGSASDPVVTSGNGPPDSTPRPRGSVHIDSLNAALYQNIDGATGWSGIVGKRELNLGSLALGATVHNWAPPGYAGEDIIVVTTSTGGGTQITGLNLGTHQVAGKEVTLLVGGSNAVTLLNDNVGSLAGNRIRTVQSASVIRSATRLRYMSSGIWHCMDKW